MSSLRVGAARTNITPPLGSHLAGSLGDRLAVDVLDELYSKAVVVEADGAMLAWVVCDLIALERAEVDVAKAMASEATGIPVDAIMVACTHTHFAPAVLPTMFGCPRNEDYIPWLVRKISDSVILAHRRLQPARMGWTRAACAEEVFNRRYHMKDGSVRMNPGIGNPDAIEPAGPTDPEIGVVAFETPDGRPIALVANYALHYVGGPYGASISADYFEAFERHLQRRLPGGPEADAFVAIMVNGCFGDINNVNVFGEPPQYPHPFAKADAVAERVAGRVWDAWRGIEAWTAEPRLSVAAATFAYKRREITDADRDEAGRILRGEQAGDELDRKYAEELLAVDRQPIEQPTRMAAFVLGDVGLATLPGEMFCQLGLDLKSGSPTALTMIAGLGNDWLGYIGPKEAFDQGGYELRTARSAKAARGMGEALTGQALDLLRQAAEQE